MNQALPRTALAALQPTEGAPVGVWAARITACWRASFEAILEVGRLLTAAKAALPHGEFAGMIASDLPFDPRWAQMLMKVSLDERITNAKHASLLPASPDALYRLSTLDDETFTARIEDGTINPTMSRGDIVKIKLDARRVERREEMRELAANPLILPQGPFGAGIADPPWEDPDSVIGFSDRHYRNKYPTMTPAQVAAMPVKQIFGPVSFMALWITRHILAIGAGSQVLEAWGFEPKTVLTWDKVWIGLGNGFVRDRTEHIVIGTRGNPPTPPPSDRPDSLFAERRSGIHSAKPASWMHEQIETWFPDTSYVELFRRGAGRDRWVSWGNESLPSIGEITEQSKTEAEGEASSA